MFHAGEYSAQGASICLVCIYKFIVILNAISNSGISPIGTKKHLVSKERKIWRRSLRGVESKRPHDPECGIRAFEAHRDTLQRTEHRLQHGSLPPQAPLMDTLNTGPLRPKDLHRLWTFHTYDRVHIYICSVITVLHIYIYICMRYDGIRLLLAVIR